MKKILRFKIIVFLFFLVLPIAFSLEYHEYFENFTLSNWNTTAQGNIYYFMLENVTDWKFSGGLYGSPYIDFFGLDEKAGAYFPNSYTIAGAYVFYMPECDLLYDCYIGENTRIDLNLSVAGQTATGSGNYVNIIGLVYLPANETYSYSDYAFKLLYADDEDGNAGGLCDLSLKYENESLAISTTTNFNYTMGFLDDLHHDNNANSVHTYCNNSIDYETKFNAFVVVHTNSGWNGAKVNNLTLDYISITGIEIGDNYLPSVNISFVNDSICLENESSVKSVDLNYSEFDIEGDTILYSYEDFSIKDVYETVKYNYRICFLGMYPCFNFIDYDFLDSVYYPNESICEVNSEIDLNYSKYNFIEYPNLDDTLVYMLNLNSICDNTSQFIYKPKSNLFNLYYYTNIYGLINEEENFNLKLYDFEFQKKLLDIRFNLSVAGNLTIYEFNSTDYNLKLNVENPDSIQFSLNFFNNDTANTFALLNVMNGLFDIDSLDTSESVGYIMLDIGNKTSIYQSDFYYSGIAESINFGNKIESLNVSEYNTQKYRIYYTDEFHLLLNQYNYTDVYIQVFECDSPYTEIELNELDEFNQAGNVVYNQFCGNFNTFLTFFEVDLDSCKMVYYAYLLICLVFSIAVTMIFFNMLGIPSFAFGLFFVIFSLSQIIVNGIFSYNSTLKIIYSGLLAFGIGAVMIAFVGNRGE